jgi:hypothetical protein
MGKTVLEPSIFTNFDAAKTSPAEKTQAKKIAIIPKILNLKNLFI